MIRPYKNAKDWFDRQPKAVQTRIEGQPIYDDYFEAIRGLIRVGKIWVLAYSEQAIINNLCEQFKKDADDQRDVYDMAVEFYEFNIVGGWIGDGTPMHLVITAEIQRAMNRWKLGTPVGVGRRCSKVNWLIYKDPPRPYCQMAKFTNSAAKHGPKVPGSRKTKGKEPKGEDPVQEVLGVDRIGKNPVGYLVSLSEFRRYDR